MLSPEGDACRLAGDGAIGVSGPLLTEADLARSIDGTVAGVRLRASFGLGLLIVALATVLLPVLYLAIVVLASYGVYLHLVYDTWILQNASLWQLVLYLGPAVAGAVMVFFLWKPILARPVRRESGVPIEPADAPLLFQFVELVRGAVGAPPPREIRLDTLVNASASFRNGLFSFARRNDLTLTLGMPLLAGMTVRQLGGVLGHELGHFAQGSGMRLTYLIRSINTWLARVAYERDSWDDALTRAARGSHWTISLPLQAGQLAVSASRKVLALLTIVGHAIGTFMLRQMELDADRYQAGIAGSDAFEPTTQRIRLLSVAREGALAFTLAEWREGRLPYDFAGLVVALAERLSPEERREIEAVRPKGSVFDTHPPDERRIASAKAERAPGILHLDLPASALLAEASPLSGRVSLALYQSGFAAGRGQLRPLAELLASHDAKVAEHGAVERYFGEVFDLLTPLGVPSGGDPPATLAEGLESLAEARDTALRLRPDKERVAAARAAARERLSAALALLTVSEVRARVGDPQAIEHEVARLGATLGVLAAESAAISRAAVSHDDLAGLFGHLSREPDNQGVVRRAMAGLASLHVETQKLEQRLGRAPYPFVHAKGALSIGGFVTHGLPEVDGIGPQVHMRTRALLGRLGGLHHRAMGRLAVLAERIELAAQEPPPAQEATGLTEERP
jgi:Zn-dependent protease with chaperone function